MSCDDPLLSYHFDYDVAGFVVVVVVAVAVAADAVVAYLLSLICHVFVKHSFLYHYIPQMFHAAPIH